jgi:potassium inwardly-rectifying channel subfamily J
MNDNRGQYHVVIVNGDINDSSSSNEFRFVNKNGHINVDYSTVGRLKYIHSNLFLFIMQAGWWLVLGFVLFSFVLSWYIFAFLYFLISIEHGDFFLTDEGANLTNYTYGETLMEREMCVKDVHNFLSALLFSIETQQSIGYGSRYITTECMGGILVLTLQSSLGYLLQVIVTQIVFSKLSRPTGKKENFFILYFYELIFRKISICCLQ